MMEGNALDQKGPELMKLRQRLEGFICMEVVIQNLKDLGGLGATQKVPFHSGGIGLATFPAKHEQECGKLMPDSEKIQGMIELMEKGLGPDLVFYCAFFPCRYLGMNLVLEGLVAILNGLDLVQIGLVRLHLELFYRGGQGYHRLIAQVVQNNMNEGHHTILGLNKVNRNLLEGAEPIGEGRGVFQGGRQKDQLNRGRNQNQRLFPDLAPIRIVDEVAFVKDNKTQVVKA